MPTGYTAKIKDGITFEEFAMGCARAFGALVSMREDSSDKPIPEKLEPSTYNRTALEEAHKRLIYLEEMNLATAEDSALSEFETETTRRKKATTENRKLIGRYEGILLEAKAYLPPTEDHVEFKEFMIQQLKSSIEFDNMHDYYTEHPIVKLDGQAWLLKEIGVAVGNIEYHAKASNVEIERTNGRNQWINDLRESLGQL